MDSYNFRLYGVLGGSSSSGKVAAGPASAAENHKGAWCHSDGLGDAFEVVYAKKHRKHGDQPAERLRDQDGHRYYSSCVHLQN